MDKYLPAAAACPICEAAELNPAFRVNYWQEFPLQFVDCAGCGASFANPMPSDQAIGLGNDALVRHYQAGATPEGEFRDARQAYLRGKMLAARLRRWKKKGKLLELGCYHGFFALGVRENCDWEVHGLEISGELASFVNEKLGVFCYLGTFEEAKVPEGTYDFIVCHDLIEHINKPSIFLEQLAAVLRPGGRVQIITPNAHQDLAFVRRSSAEGHPSAMLLNHIMYFRPRTLEIALRKAGLEPRKLYTYDVRHALKDFNVLGTGTPISKAPAPSAFEVLKNPKREVLKWWTPDRLRELKNHPKVSARYGFLKETLPRAFQLKVPPALEIGHEIYALAEKPR